MSENQTAQVTVASGASEERVEITLGGKVSDLRQLLAPMLGTGVRDASVMVDGQEADDDTPLYGGEEVEFSRRDGSKAF